MLQCHGRFACYVTNTERRLIAHQRAIKQSQVMAQFTVTVPDTIMLGRNGSIGTLQVDWSHIPQQVKDHIASVYFPST